MRSLDNLCKLYPHLTGQELLDMQEQDRKDEEAAERARLNALVDRVNFVRQNPYFKKTDSYGRIVAVKLTQVLLNISGCSLLILFERVRIHIDGDEEIRLEYAKHENATSFYEIDLDDSRTVNITEEEYNKIVGYVKNVRKQWGEILCK